MLVAAGRRRGPLASKGTPSWRQPDSYLRASREDPTVRRKFTIDSERLTLTLHLMLQRQHIRRVPPTPEKKRPTPAGAAVTLGRWGRCGEKRKTLAGRGGLPSEPGCSQLERPCPVYSRLALVCQGHN